MTGETCTGSEQKGKGFKAQNHMAHLPLSHILAPPKMFGIFNTPHRILFRPWVSRGCRRLYVPLHKTVILHPAGKVGDRGFLVIPNQYQDSAHAVSSKRRRVRGGEAWVLAGWSRITLRARYLMRPRQKSYKPKGRESACWGSCRDASVGVGNTLCRAYRMAECS